VALISLTFPAAGDSARSNEPMPRSVWKGHISFGLVNIPVTLYSAEERKDLHFRLLDSRNKARVRYERVNEETGEEVPRDQIVKAFEYDSGNYVLLTDEDFERAAVEATKTIEIESFVNGEEIDPAYFDKPYYLEPGSKGEKGYALLRETLRSTGRVGVARVVIRTREYLAALMPRENMLVLNVMRFADELRPHDQFDLPTADLKEYKVSKQEVNMAEKLVEAMSDEWDPHRYKDEYRETLMAYIQKKIDEGSLERPLPAAEAEEEPATGNVVNMMSLLKESIEQQGNRTKEVTKTKKKTSKKPTPQSKRAAG
jgi:DNA end-binding protein Ku